MGKAGSFGTTGFRQLDRKLARLAQATPRRKVDGVLRVAATVIAVEQRRLIRVVTGRHRRTITVTNAPGFDLDGMGPRDVSVFVGPRRGGAGSTMHLLEWGTAHSAAHPFARPAVDTKGGEAIGIVVAGLRALVEEAAR
ncbi:HK97-gp10 family putative phage morphogenesis protein [Sphingomonas hankookensis]|uniref:HK97-gp10 family putative phage morphogenesis protein n=1 Tax=Sphingomonas hankookensis TaxID=563996 RepID=UPI003D301DB5